MADNILRLESGAIMSDTHDENEGQKVILMKNVSSPPDPPDPPTPPALSDPTAPQAPPDASAPLIPPDSPATSNSSAHPVSPDLHPKGDSQILSFIDKYKTLIETIVGGFIGAALLAAVINIFSFPYKMERLEIQIDDLTKLVETQGTDIKEIKESVEDEKWDRATAISESEKDMQKYVRNEIDRTIKYISKTELRPTDAMEQAIKDCADTDDFSSGGSGWGLTATTLVAYNISTKIEYSVEEIANQRVLLPYLDGKKEGYFYGQLSETGAWDGECLINVYENGKLVFIKEAVYDDGRLLSSRQAFPYHFSDGQDVWAISDRTNKGDHSEGETKIYKWEQDYIQSFEREEVAPKDIIDIDTFQKGLDPNLFAYYYGSVSGEFFKDESGTSYMVRFFEDGTVRWLYVGNFENGRFNDNTGNAWYIVREENTDYMYYEGKFKDNRLVERIDMLPPPLSLEQIKEIIGDRTFNVELNWNKLGVT